MKPVLLAVLLVSLPCSLLAAEKAGVTLGGKAQNATFAPGGLVHFDFSVSAESGQLATVASSRMFVASRGGWAWLAAGVSPLPKGGLVVAPGEPFQANGFTWTWSSPLTQVILGAELTGGERLVAGQFAIPRTNFPAPEPIPNLGPVFFSLQEPLEIVELGAGRVVTVLGQIVNTTGHQLRVRNAVARVGADTRELPGGDGLSEPLLPLLLVLPTNKEELEVKLSAEIQIDREEKPRQLSRTATARLTRAKELAPPVKGTWFWINGPGEPKLHTHLQFPEQRYAYDLLVDREGATFAGDPRKNESYLAWDKPFFAMAAGTVLDVIDDVPENLGNADNPKNTPRRNAWIVIAHDDGTFASYMHLRPGSARVKPGEKVEAGRELGRVGNAGYSSEPHLHIQLTKWDVTGRAQAVPMAFSLAAEGAMAAVKAVPRGAVHYTAVEKAAAK